MSISKRNAERYFSLTKYEALPVIQHKEYRAPHPTWPLVYICSPFAGDIAGNIERARQFCRFAVSKNTIPLATHLLYPQFMSDDDAAQRELALFFALVLLGKCDEVWVFGERISEGMKREIVKARSKGIPIKFFTEDCEVRT